MRHSVPRLRTTLPMGSSPRVDRCSTSPSGKRSRRMGVCGMRRSYLGCPPAVTAQASRRRTPLALPGALPRQGLDQFDVHEDRASSFCVRDPPETVPSPELVAGGGHAVYLGRSDLEVTVGVPDLEDLGSHRTSPPIA